MLTVVLRLPALKVGTTIVGTPVVDGWHDHQDNGRHDDGDHDECDHDDCQYVVLAFRPAGTPLGQLTRGPLKTAAGKV